jgi:isopentenyl diphosphate isomerase/L-lactate dehydrogenase-like FMN-dependent dehydrogenase
MDKQLLQAKVDELELTLNSLELNAKTVKDDLMEATKKLEDVSKPIITKEVVEQIRAAVHQAIKQISFDNVDSYDVDFEIDYNNKLALGSIEFN